MSGCNHEKCLRDKCATCCYCGKELAHSLTDFDVSSNDQKVYVHSGDGFCVARLCKLSAEIWDKGVEANCKLISGCAFEQFQREVKDTFGVDIQECHRPVWSKPPEVYAVGEPKFVGEIPERKELRVKALSEVL